MKPFLSLLLLATLDAGVCTGLAQGSLTPPGAPAPTMKSLEQVEPRMDLSQVPGDVTYLHIITNAGSYYLTTNVVVPAGHFGIRIATSNVTLDLNGFSLSGNSAAAYGIEVPNFQTNIVVRNGMVTGFTAYGVYGQNVYNGLFEHLLVSRNTYAGLAAGRAGRVRDCQAFGNLYDGISASGYSSIENCSAFGNTQVGIHLYEAASRIENNHLAGNGYGLRVESGGNVLLRNSATGNVTNNYSVVAGNLFAPSVTSSTIATNSNPHANYDF